MQGLWIKTQSSPLEAPYFSCVPYLLGEGQAMQYSVWPKSKKKTRIPRLPFRPPDDYLRNAMVASLAGGDVDLDFRVQLQTDPHLMPIENNARAVARATVAACIGGDASPAAPDFHDHRRRWNLRAVSRTTRGTAFRNIVRWATRAVRAGGCTGRSRTAARR